MAGAVSAQDAAQKIRSARGLNLSTLKSDSVGEIDADPVDVKLDVHARRLMAASETLGKQGLNRVADELDSTIGLHETSAGRVLMDVLVELKNGFRPDVLDQAGAVVRVQVGNIVVARVPVDNLRALASTSGVRRVESSILRKGTNRAAVVETGASKLHAGTGLARSYRGEGVVVGVLDTGIDFTHLDFSTNAGTRIQYLLEYTADGGERQWTKAQIDANPAAVTERDGNGGGGHGTHVTGIAAGGGRANALMTGVAPASDIIFVKGVRDPDSDGGFGDADVIAGAEYIFRRAGQMGKPAVVNLSLGGNWGPLDGSSLYEQALSNLTGPGKIIVAAAGNEGSDVIHAGGTTYAGLMNQTLVHPAGSDDVHIGLWYDPGVISEVNVAVLELVDGILEPVVATGWVPVGASLDATAMEFEDKLAGFVSVDAETTRDPDNGDGFVYFNLSANGDENIDMSEFIWGIYSRGNANGRVDLWTLEAEFEPVMLGVAGVNELPGNSEQTIGMPATAEKVISVGSYVTSNSWTNIDGGRMEWLNPDPQNPGYGIVPVIGQHSYFSSRGPTRDGRIAPDIAAPGEFIFSAMSSHLTEGAGYDRENVHLGGRYIGQQGTSMASPHLAGVVALMLQANPTLDYDGVMEILRETARSDAQTGAAPNNRFGAGRVDAYNAVRAAAGTNTNPGNQVSVALRNFDASGDPRVLALDRVFPVDSGFVAGTNIYLDKAKASAFTLPNGKLTGTVSEVKVWFNYKQAGTDGRKYAIEIYGGTTATGPTGAPLARKEFGFSNIQADADLETDDGPTTHTFSTPVAVGQNFFVSVDFGQYDASRAGDLGIGTTNFTGSRVAQVWDQLVNGSWLNTSDAWSFGGNAGDDGVQLWIETTALVISPTADEPAAELPNSVSLDQNYPNPFNPQTAIGFTLPASGNVRLAVYDLLGRQIATLVDEQRVAGSYSVTFDASGLSSGLYVYRLETAQASVSRTMTVVK